MILDGHKTNFDTLQRAIRNKQACLMECTDAQTGQPVIVVCAIQRDGDDYTMVPLAKLFNGNPYAELIPPTTEEA